MGVGADLAEVEIREVQRRRSRSGRGGYARGRVDLDEPGDEDVFRKVMGDFARAGVAVPGKQVREKMEKLLAEARRQLGIN